MPGYKKRNRLRMSPILHPTDFADFALLYKIVCCLAIARQQQYTFLPLYCDKNKKSTAEKTMFFHAESMITSMLRHVNRELHHGILFDRRLGHK